MMIKLCQGISNNVNKKCISNRGKEKVLQYKKHFWCLNEDKPSSRNVNRPICGKSLKVSKQIIPPVTSKRATPT